VVPRRLFFGILGEKIAGVEGCLNQNLGSLSYVKHLWSVVPLAESSKAPDRELTFKVVGSSPGRASNFSIPDCKKIN